MDFVWDKPGEPVPEETFTHLHISWWSSIVTYLLHPSNMIHSILPVQSTCLAPSTSYSIHFFTKSSSSFHNTCMPIPSQRVLL